MRPLEFLSERGNGPHRTQTNNRSGPFEIPNIDPKRVRGKIGLSVDHESLRGVTAS